MSPTYKSNMTSLIEASTQVLLFYIYIQLIPFQASDDKRTQKEIGDIAGVADVTIRQSYKLMYSHAKQLFPDDFKFSVSIDQLPQL